MWFIYFLDAIGLVGIAVLFFASIIGSIFLFKYLIDRNGARIQAEHRHTGISTKKYYSVDLDKYSGLFRNIGLTISLAVCLAAFEFPSFEEQKLIDLGTVEAAPEEQIEIPPTQQNTPPPPPQIKAPQIVEVKNEEEIKQEVQINMDMEMDQETVIEEVEKTTVEAPKEEVVDEIFEIVEEGAEPIGGMSAFLKWVAENIKYPAQARRMNIEGKVVVQFVVDKDGSLTDIKVLRGIGGGCDEEAVRVLQKAAKWKPGKQRGKPVKQRMSLPISFKLQ
ncbi:MAG: energy transducer TonB [Flammeovirgaceae bacterium]|nr:energy transducer TonB [Flammeovirgaceae bacterium]